MLGYITGLRALLASQIGMRTSGNNVANAATPGYSRQRVQFVTTPSIQIDPRLRLGTGVNVSRIDRVVDPLLDARIRTQERALGRYDVLSLAYSEIEVAFQEPTESGLNAQLAGLFSSITSLTTSPQDGQLRSSLLQAASSLTERFHLLASQGDEIRRTLTGQIDQKVEDVNRLAESIALLNQRIAEETGGGGPANEARDQRDLLLKEMNRIVDADVLEQQNGTVTVLVSGQILVSEYRTRSLEYVQESASSFRVRFADSREQVHFRDGELQGLLEAIEDVVPDVVTRLDELARSLIFEFNRTHSTGTPRDGGFDSLTSTYPVSSTVGNRNLVKLSETGLEFPPEAGDLFVSVTDLDSGQVRRTRIFVDPEHHSLQDLAGMLSAVDGITSGVDGQGRIRIDADPGYQFNFATSIDPDPDDIGSFGGARATVSGSFAGPFSLADGDALSIEVDGQPAQVVTFNATDFEDITAATAEEVAAAIESQTTGVRAEVVGEQLVLQSATSGTSSSLTLADATGSPVSALGLTTATATGTDTPVAITTSGTYTGQANHEYRFVASGTGEIGVTDGLTVDVFDESGTRIATLDVGADYVPGTELSVVNGINVSFSEGSFSGDTNDFFVVDGLADSDTGDLLAALGLNPFFQGTDASSIEVAEAIMARPDLISGGLTGAPGDGQNFLRLLDLQQQGIASLGASTFESYYGSLVADIGAGGLRSLQFYESQAALTNFLAQQRDSVSGVSLDEEAVNLLQYQRSFEAAARYIQVVDQAMGEVLSLVR